MAMNSTITEKKSKVILAATVGGSPSPVAFSIATTKPDQVIFFPSPGSKEQITQRGEAPAEPRGRDGRGILQLLETIKRPLAAGDYRIDPVEAENLLPCVEEMRRVLTEEVDRAGGETRLILDFTGGTKMMSAALAIAGETFDGAQYSYVAARHGGKSRDKGGLGVTLDGQEKQVLRENPRDLSSFGAIDDARRLARSGAWAGAAKLLENHRMRLTDPARKRELEAWTHLFRAYSEWDRLHYAGALKALQNARSLEARLAVHQGARASRALLKTLAEHEETLGHLAAGEDSGAFIRDLLANADRLVGRKYLDEAFQRYYRIIELAGSTALWERHGIDSSKASSRQMPEGFLREEGHQSDGPVVTMKLALQKTWSLLGHLDDPLAGRFRDLKLTARPGAKSILDLRNDLVLTHGRKSVTSNQVQKIRYAVYTLLGVREASLVRFPRV